MKVERTIERFVKFTVSRVVVPGALLLFASVSTTMLALPNDLSTSHLLLLLARGRPSAEGVDSELRTPQQVSRTLARAEAGSPHDQFLIGYSYANGLGQAQDFSQAAIWYERAAERGDPAASTELGRLYAQGLGVHQDYKMALQWFRRAAGEGYAPAQTDLGLMYFQGLARRATKQPRSDGGSGPRNKPMPRQNRIWALLISMGPA